MIRVGIAGGAGYTAGELIRILLNHPGVELSFILSSSNAGNPVSQVHTDLIGETDLVFTDTMKAADVLFLCMGHGQSRKFLEDLNLKGNFAIIDLSHDYRLKAASGPFIYGLPELNRDRIKQTRYIANPGCFATAIQLALLPLAAENRLQDEVHVTAITGSTGAGQKPSETTHFSWRNNNISVYKAFNHQHLGEIRESVEQLQPNFSRPIHFVPVRGDFTRGILASIYTRFPESKEMAESLYRNYYLDHPFVHLSVANPDLKQVVNTNKCILHLEKHGDMLLIVSLIDNLVKGASGQAVQNLNLMFGLPETESLRLKPSAF
jgi:N-acetyl-gamma-glutamyl-phosphate reductase